MGLFPLFTTILTAGSQFSVWEYMANKLNEVGILKYGN